MFECTTSAVKALFSNMIFLSTICSICAAQVLKGVFHAVGSRPKEKKELLKVVTWRTGGMPSAHAAVVCSLCASIAFVEGITSNLFVFSFWFALVVLRDAVGVRRSAGLLAKALNHMGKQTAEKAGIDFQPVKEIQGHTPLEVTVGGVLGIVIAVTLNLLF